MTWRLVRSLWPVVAWFAFPMVPAVLAQFYYGFFILGGADPRVWDWQHWVLQAGPLIGFGFLAGATAGIPDVPGRRWWKAVLTSRAAWVAVGPWLGFVILLGALYALERANRLAESLLGPNLAEVTPPTILIWIMIALFWTLPYAWVILAWAAVRRASRVGQLWQALRRGLFTALAFLGSLFGSFWAATEVWRSYFFDPAIVRSTIIAALCLTALTGCGAVTVGEIRRRELFEAMLAAWVIGLAIAWRWWGRPRAR